MSSQVLVLAPEELAECARLRYVVDDEPGIARERNGHGFVYINGRGVRIRDAAQIARIEDLAIPPAWTDVWICRYANGHLQATGRDARRRKQYLYHPRWREAADMMKFSRLGHFGRLLPKLRTRIARNLSGKELSRKRVLAGMVALLDATSIRIGNEEYVRANNSYGLATLRTRHVVPKNSHVELRFRTKGGQHREVIIDDKRLVRLLTQLRRLRGAHVFRYLDPDGAVRRADAATVNEYLRDVMGQPFTAKDFRTWKASALAAGILVDHLHEDSHRARRKVIKQAIAEAAAALGNTPTICRKSYIHVGLLECYEAGEMPALMGRFRPRRKARQGRDEACLAHFIRRWESQRNAASR